MEKEKATNEPILDALIYQASAMMQMADVKGFTPFTESAQTGKLRVQMYALITKLQLLRVLPEDLHIKGGALVKSDDDNSD